MYASRACAGLAHHALEVLNPGAIALRPRGGDVAIAVLRHRAAEAMLGVVGHRQQRHVRAVAGAEDAEPLAVDPVERAQVVRRGEAVLRVAHSPVAVVLPFEVAAVAGRAAEVDGEPRVAHVHEVLRVAVPFVAVTVGRPAVRIHHGGNRIVRRCSRGPHQERGDLEAVERLVGHVLELRVRGAADRLRGRRVEGRGARRRAPRGGARAA